MAALLVGIDLFSDKMGDDCIVRIIGASLMINSYFVTLFSITAMAVNRLSAIVFPFAYLEFLRGSCIKKVCVGVWTVGFLIALFHNIVNSGIITSCTNSKYKEVYVSVGILKHNVIIIGIVNLLSLILNMLLFLSLFFYLMKKNYNERDHAIPILKRLSVIFVAYTILYGPFCIVTIVMALILDKDSGFAWYGNFSVIQSIPKKCNTWP